MSYLILPEFSPHPFIPSRYYSVIEGGELSAGYIIGNLMVSASISRENTLSTGTFVSWKCIWYGSFQPRDMERYTQWGANQAEDPEDVLSELFVWLHSHYPRSGPYHAVRVSTLPPT